VKQRQCVDVCCSRQDNIAVAADTAAADAEASRPGPDPGTAESHRSVLASYTIVELFHWKVLLMFALIIYCAASKQQ